MSDQTLPADFPSWWKWSEQQGGFANQYDAALYAWRRAEPLIPAHAWRCFHCDETFTSVEMARDHFGATERCDPACRVNIKAFRQLEAVLHRWTDQGGTDAEVAADSAARAREGKHLVALQREEEKGYARGLADARAECAAITEALREACADLASLAGIVGDLEGDEKRVAAYRATLPILPDVSVRPAATTVDVERADGSTDHFDLSPAQVEGKVRDALVALGWTPPDAPVPRATDEAVAWMRQWATERAKPLPTDKHRQFLAVTRDRLFDEDVPLYAAPRTMAAQPAALDREDALDEALRRSSRGEPWEAATHTPAKGEPDTWEEYARAVAARLFANPHSGRSSLHVVLMDAMRFAASAATCTREHCGPMCEQTLAERDGNERWANELADAIARHLGIHIGEWETGMGSAESNSPWQNALLAIDSAAVPGAAGNYADGVHDAAEVFFRMAGTGRTDIYNAINALAEAK